MIAYLDASALVKLLVEEDGSEIVREVWESDLPAVTARIARTEIACALGAALREARLGEPAAADDVLDGTFLWRRADAIEATARMVETAARLSVAHRLRALDAVHLASVCSLRDLHPVLVSWDGAQPRAAEAEVLPVYS